MNINRKSYTEFEYKNLSEDEQIAIAIERSQTEQKPTAEETELQKVIELSKATFNEETKKRASSDTTSNSQNSPAKKKIKLDAPASQPASSTTTPPSNGFAQLLRELAPGDPMYSSVVESGKLSIASQKMFIVSTKDHIAFLKTTYQLTKNILIVPEIDYIKQENLACIEKEIQDNETLLKKQQQELAELQQELDRVQKQ